MNKTSNARDYLRAAGFMAAYGVLAAIWLLVLLQFADVMLLGLKAGLAGPVLNTPPCNNPDCDFSMYWPAGRLARLGQFQTLYDTNSFQLWRQQNLFAGVQKLDWFYPPPGLLPVMAISVLPFHLAFLVWTAALILAAIMILRVAAVSWRVIGLALLSPASLWNIEMGQLEIFGGAVLVAGFLIANRSPARAGALFGLLLIKPQMALLVPFALLARWNFRAVAAGCVTVALILAATFVIFGPPVWAAYFAHGLHASGATLTLPHPLGGERGVSVFWMVRSLGGGIMWSYVVQGLIAAMAAILTWRIWRCGDLDATQRMALTVFLSLLATPYGYTDDMVAWSIALAALARRRRWRIDLLDVLFWLWPALCPVVTLKTGILLTPLVVVLAILRTWRRGTLDPEHLPGRAAVLPGSGSSIEGSHG